MSALRPKIPWHGFWRKMEESNPYRYQHHRVQTGSPTTERHLPETKKPRAMARLIFLSGQTQIRQPTLNILLICSLKSKHVMNIFCDFLRIIANDERILHWLIKTEECRIECILNFPANG